MPDYDAAAWRYLGRVVYEERHARGHRDFVSWAEASGVHRQTLTKLEQGQPVRRDILRAVSTALGWAPSHAEEILATGRSGAGLLDRSNAELAEEVGRRLAPLDTLRVQDLRSGQVREFVYLRDELKRILDHLAGTGIARLVQNWIDLLNSVVGQADADEEISAPDQ